MSGRSRVPRQRRPQNGPTTATGKLCPGPAGEEGTFCDTWVAELLSHAQSRYNRWSVDTFPSLRLSKNSQSFPTQCKERPTNQPPRGPNLRSLCRPQAWGGLLLTPAEKRRPARAHGARTRCAHVGPAGRARAAPPGPRVWDRARRGRGTARPLAAPATPRPHLFLRQLPGHLSRASGPRLTLSSTMTA